MREIKFRAWIKSKKFGQEMFNVIMISWVGKEIILSGKGGSVGLEDCVLMQYTGLKDKNGKEIWEGDVVKEPDEWGGSRPNHEVGYDESGYWLFQGRNYYDSEVGINWDEFEVIGNIWENPELLTK